MNVFLTKGKILPRTCLVYQPGLALKVWHNLLLITGWDVKPGDMKPLYHFVLILSLILVAGCSAIAGIFKAGMWTGILIVVVIIGVILWLISRSGSKD